MLQLAAKSESGDACNDQVAAGTDLITRHKTKLKAIQQQIAETNAKLQAFREARIQSATASTGGIEGL